MVGEKDLVLKTDNINVVFYKPLGTVYIRRKGFINNIKAFLKLQPKNQKINFNQIDSFKISKDRPIGNYARIFLRLDNGKEICLWAGEMDRSVAEEVKERLFEATEIKPQII